jgi:hypothetical protein
MKLSERQRGLLQDAADDSLMTVHPSYSGRGMYGETCYGVSGSVHGLVAFILYIAADDPEFANELINVSWDDLGMDKIYYWTDLEGQ